MKLFAKVFHTYSSPKNLALQLALIMFSEICIIYQVGTIGKKVPSYFW